MLTLLSREQGRFSCVARSVRTLKSTRSSALESGNVIKAFFIKTNPESSAHPLLTQTQLLSDCEPIRTDLGKISQLMQFLEIADQVIHQEELSLEIWREILLIRQMILSLVYPHSQIKEHLCHLLSLLGFAQDFQVESISQQVSNLTGKKLVGYDYLHY
jgi:recombinational DNA repair protein (RecF pathway)